MGHARARAPRPELHKRKMAGIMRLDSRGRAPDDEASIKSATQRFDVGIVFKLNLGNKGLQAIHGLGNCINLTELNVSDNALTK